ncbi:DUF58 domain-containing protein [Nocardioides sp.]|uniref:DUF58 domain-containing protein n=1 Tax=Nocardioides sp. TaxID=35761 RepID=UPI00352874BA
MTTPADPWASAGWRPSPALVRALLWAAAGLVGGVVFGEPALVVLGAPFALHAAVAAVRRPRRAPSPAVTSWGLRELVEGQARTATLTLTDPTARDETEHVTWVVRPPARLRCEPEAVSGVGDAAVSLRVEALRWGPAELDRQAYQLHSAWGGFVAGPTPLPPVTRRVLPAVESYDASAPLPHPLGLVGVHGSRREGRGLEYLHTRPFVPGDRLRRVNWRVSTRTPTLQVDTTRTEDDASLLLVVDLTSDIGDPQAGPTSADRAVRAAVTLARHHLVQGDRVGLQVLSATSAMVRPGAGRRHLRRIQAVLAGTIAGAGDTQAALTRLTVAPGTTMVLFSPLLSARVVDALGRLRRRGQVLVVVDTLPPGVRPAIEKHTDPELASLAWRMRALDREEVVLTLQRAGAPVIPWVGPRSLDQVLRRLTRVDRRPA